MSAPTKTLADTDPSLVEMLQRAGDKWGALGVALAAAHLTDAEALVRHLAGLPSNADDWPVLCPLLGSPIRRASYGDEGWIEVIEDRIRASDAWGIYAMRPDCDVRLFGVDDLRGALAWNGVVAYLAVPLALVVAAS